MNKNTIDLITKYPLYNSIKDNTLNIYVFGNNMDFVDCALQLGQIEGVTLNVYWDCSKSIKASYLINRPSLDKFISIDEKLIDSFASIYFGEIKEVEKDGYCISDKLNKEKLEGIKNSKYRFILDDKIIPLDNNKIDNFFSNIKEIERMAYNINTIWYGKTKYSKKELDKSFNDSYNYNSSMICAISIEYKLIMADILEDDYNLASNEFIKLKENSDKYKKLAYNLALYEHRRWCIEKLVDGWNPLNDINDINEYSYFVESKTLKNKENKVHPAIAKMNFNKEFIDIFNLDNIDYDSLDDLDRVSFNIHKVMLEDSNKLNKENIYLKLNNLSKIVNIELYSRYEIIVQNIMDGISEKEEKLAIISKSIKKEYKHIDFMIDEINDLLYTKLEANKLRNFKKNNIDIIENIPFILSYKPNLNLGNFMYKITNRYADSNDLFKTIASTITIYPKNLHSVVFIDSDIELKYIIHRLESFNKFYNLRDLGIKEKYLFLFDNINKIEDVKKELDGKYRITYEKYDDINTSYEIIMNYFKENMVEIIDISYLPYDTFKNNHRLMNILHNDFSYFEFDNKNQEFIDTYKCDYLGMLKKDNYITVEEMFMLNNAKTIEDSNPNYIDNCKFYWDVFTGKSIGIDDFALSSHLWNIFCISSRNPNGFSINSFGMNNRSKILKIVNHLESNNKIYEKDGLYHFLDERDRELTEKSGDLLEFYVFYELLKSNYFSDVKTGYVVKWKDLEVDNELDAVVTLNYKSVLVECKVIKSMDQNFYLKIDSIADHFGINYKTIIIAISETLISKNNIYFKRGENLDVITISSLNDLNNIANKIKEIMK